MSKDKIEVNMNVYDIPIVIEALEKSEDEIKKLQQENQQLKKQKDDAFEYIKSAIENDDIEELKEGRHLLLWNEDLDKLLRMLGEIDDN